MSERFANRALLRTALIALLAGCLPACEPAPEAKPPPQSAVTAKETSPAPASPTKHKHTNRLAKEKSPYLLQHAHNPVDWHPWGEEAFARARAENKPIFLSIGYSTCHWCHVMERESFEDEQVARYLNAHFISIKIDREERPDVDKIYMTAMQAMGLGGGWPLNVFITADRKPFYGGTYFPPESRQGRPSFTQLLERIVDLWQTRREEILTSANDLSRQLASLTARQSGEGATLSADFLKNAAIAFKHEYDPRYGGFGSAPKFPRPTQPAFLLRYGTRFKDNEAVKMVLHTCDQMAAGGMYDQLGGGFARYSVDEKWLVPHFEKMLYDNAQLISLYLDAHLISGEARHAEVARDIIRYVLRDMTHPGGGFYSAEDADSEGQEGKFYCWTKAELEKLLTPDENKVAVRHFGITPDGNFIDHSNPAPLPNLNILSVVDPKLSPDEKTLLATARQKMFDVRSKRVRPHLDDKILASWNGLMLGAISRAYAVLGDESYRAAAEKDLAFLQAKLWDAQSKTLYHRWRDGERDNAQLLDDYSGLLSGVIELYQATLEAKHLEFALALADGMIARFYDPEHGGFFQSAATPDLIMRVKEDYDGAEPSGNSVATLALLKLATITDNKDYRDKAGKTLQLLAQQMERLPQAVPNLLLGLDYWLEEPRRVVIAGDPRSTAARKLLRAAHSVYQPNKVVLSNAGPVEPFAKTLPAKDGPTVYLCTGTACQPPTQEVAKLQQMLR